MSSFLCCHYDSPCSSHRAAQNAYHVKRILMDMEGSAVLYRTCVAGPSGQRRDVAVARVEYTRERGYELAVHCPPGAAGCRCDEPAGYLARNHGCAAEWTVYGTRADAEGYWLKGYADSPAIGADVLINGEHAATGNHDHARISRGGWIRYVPRSV